MGRRALRDAAAHGRRTTTTPRLKPNDLSCVVRIDSEHGSVLLTGDLEARGELELVRRDAACAEGRRAASCRITAAGRRRRPRSSPRSRREIAVYTPGYRNRFGHPRPDVVARYDAAGVRTYRTDYDGALTFTFAPGASQTPRAEREHDRRYWRDAPLRESRRRLDRSAALTAPASHLHVRLAAPKIDARRRA